MNKVVVITAQEKVRYSNTVRRNPKRDIYGAQMSGERWSAFDCS